jgi:hypothetical protein
MALHVRDLGDGPPVVLLHSTRGELPSAEAFTRAVRQARTLRRETVAAAGERVPQWTLEGRPTSAVAWSTW